MNEQYPAGTGATYPYPQYYEKKELLDIIEKHLNEGLEFREIGSLFGVSEGGIKYHWRRYKSSFLM